MRHASLFAALLLASLAAGCDPVTAIVGAGAEVGVAASSEKGVGGTMTDTKIQTEIDGIYINHNAKIFQDITVTVTEGRVQLTGKVKEPDERVEAVRLAWQASGVRAVINEIQVTDQSGLVDYGRDLRIATTLRAKLLFDSHIKNVNYTVDVENAIVYLMGIAQDQAELDAVIAHARDISGVVKVVNNVVLKNDAARRAS